MPHYVTFFTNKGQHFPSSSAATRQFFAMAEAVTFGRAYCEARPTKPALGFLVTGPRGVEHSELL